MNAPVPSATGSSDPHVWTGDDPTVTRPRASKEESGSPFEALFRPYRYGQSRKSLRPDVQVWE